MSDPTTTPAEEAEINLVIWRPVLHAESKYEVSSDGRVRGHTRLGTKTLTALPNRRGYLIVTLYYPQRGKTTRPVHRLVLEAFAGPRPAGMECGHLDGNKQNNRRENLRWVTGTENQAHRRLHGTACLGESNPTSRLTNDDVRTIRRTHLRRKNTGALAKRFGITPECVRYIVRGVRWSHVS